MLFVHSTAMESFALPICKGSPAKAGDNVSSWTNCKGTYTWSSGDKYVGEYKNGKRHGQGTYTWPSGVKYLGEWKRAKPHGQGTKTWPDGTKYVGEFRNGDRHGQGRYVIDGRTYAGVFVNDGLTGKVGLKFYSRKKNTSNSQWRIGNIYAGGLGVPKDLHKAVEHYSKAASKGHTKSKSALNSMRTKHERTAIEACMFENIQKVKNNQTERIVKKYCKNQVAEKSLKELLPKQKRKRAKWF